MRDEVALNSSDADSEAQFLASCRRLSHALTRYRRQGALELGEHGSRAAPALSRSLLDPDLSVREAATESLGRIGTPAALAALCEALDAATPATRALVARTLGDVGDADALAPLVRTLRCYISLSSAQNQDWWILLALLALLCSSAIVMWSPHLPHLWSVSFLFLLLIVIWRAFLEQQRRRSKICAAITEAIGNIAERHPGPERHGLLPDLRAVSRDHFLQDRTARRAARNAAARIEALTADYRRLPLAASPPVADHSVLPLISGLPGGDSASELDPS